MMTATPRSTAVLAFVVLLAAASCQAFTIQPQQCQLLKQQLVPSLKTTTNSPQSRRLSTTTLHGSYFDDEDEDDREFARIRGGRRTRVMEYDDEELLDDLEDVVNDYYDDDDNEFDGVIPNPLLDNIDPEGSSERIGELFSDRQFWIDIGLLFLFLNFLDNLRDPAVFDAIDIATMQ
jgi:hypothetical protein